MKSDSEEFLREVAHDAIVGIKPPKYARLRKCDLPYWKDITDARFDWTEVDLAHAVNLARAMADAAREQETLDKEGYVLDSKTHRAVQNPRHRIVKDLVSRIISLSSKLQVHAAATIGEIENNRFKNAAKNAAVKELGTKTENPDQAQAEPRSEDDLLIPRPSATH